MALDESAKIANIKWSFKKYMIDNIFRVESIRVSFDMDLTPPEKQGVPYEEWVSVNYGTTIRDPKTGNIASQMINLICCSRKDPEAVDLDGMADTVISYLGSSTGRKKIDLYNKDTKTKIGTIVIYIDAESGQQTAKDQTKYSIISITLKWGVIK